MGTRTVENGAASSRAIEAALRHHQSGRLSDAEAGYREVLATDRENIDALHFLGVIAYQRAEYEQAAALIAQALSANDANAPAHNNLGNVLVDQGKLDEAAACYQRALALQPGYVDAHVNLGGVFKSLGRLAEAEASYREALRIRPESAQARFGQALLKLLRGEYAAGLALYESRFEEDAVVGDASARTRMKELMGAPRWRGESLSGKRLLVWTEQGLGDNIMAMRFLPLLKNRRAQHLVVYCDPALARIVQGVSPVDKVVTRDLPIPFGEFDFHCPMMSLPLAFDTRVETIPNDIPYLFVPSGLKKEWAGKLAGTAGLKVGLAWAGSKTFARDRLRSIRLERFSPMFGIPDVKFISLQKDEAAAQIRESGLEVLDWMDECGDVLDTAALIEQLDLVVSVDTGMAHLAGALGKPVWLLNRHESEWRWMLDRKDSPWYPTMRIFRQRDRGDWDAVLEDVASELRGLGLSVRKS